jgi:DNA-binding NarL/FixJ family response regulator
VVGSGQASRADRGAG